MRKSKAGIVPNGSGGVLLVRKKDTWILPGGNPENTETFKQTLEREFAEEVPDLKISSISDNEIISKTSGLSPNKGTMIEISVFLVNVTETPITLRTANEILEAAWAGPEVLNSNYSGPIKLSNLTRQILEKLWITEKPKI